MFHRGERISGRRRRIAQLPARFDWRNGMRRHCQICGEPMGKAEWHLGRDRLCPTCWKLAVGALAA